MGGRGRFLVVEGLDGAGTTTQTDRLARWLRSRGIPVHATSEPTDGIIGKLLRGWLEAGEVLPPTTAALLFAADRDHHLRDAATGVLRLLESGTWVVSDRYLLSSLAYQTVDGVELDDLLAINRLAPDPDLTVFLDVDPEVALERIAGRGEPASRYETGRTLAAVHRAYQGLLTARRGVGTLLVVDGSGTAEEVEAAVGAALAPHLPAQTRDAP